MFKNHIQKTKTLVTDIREDQKGESKMYPHTFDQLSSIKVQG
jgi:hypothetical protein